MQFVSRKYTISGITPLIMHADELANPLSPLKKKMGQLSSQRKKTDEVHEEMAKIEWLAGLYHDENGVFVPGINLEASIRDAAKLQRLGKESVRSLRVEEEKAPLEYKGPKDVMKLADLPAFRDVRSVVVQRARVMRCRPIFREWKCQFTVVVDADRLDVEQVDGFIETAGLMIGIGDFRPRYGRFMVEGVG